MIRYIIAFSAGAVLASAQPVVSLVALDRQGQNVLDLKSDELQVLDDGRPQQIASFRRPDKASESKTVILFDLMNTAPGARGNVQQQIVQSLHALAPSGSISLYLLAGDGTLHAVRGLNASDLDDALRSVQMLRVANLDAIGARVRATYTALAELSTMLTGYPGRKGVVWITHGVPLHGMSQNGTPVDYLPVLKKMAATLGQAQIVLYPVEQTISAAVAASDTSVDTLQQFASITGGRVYPHGSIEKAISGAMNDGAASYLLTYQPPNAKQDGKYHTIRVTCSRPGIRVQTQQGYFADR